jgi:hypothetical protein
MRIRTRFSLRTLLIAIVVIALGVRWFVASELFHTRRAVLLWRSGLQGTDQAVAYLSEHQMLPGHIRLRAVSFGPISTLTPSDDMVSQAEVSRSINFVRTRIDWGPWRTDEGYLVLADRHGDDVRLRISGNSNQGTAPTETAAFQRVGGRVLTWPMLLRFTEDDHVGEWSLEALEAWIKENGK